MVLNFLLRCVKFSFIILRFSVLYDLFSNKAKKLEVAESKPIMEHIPISLLSIV